MTTVFFVFLVLILNIPFLNAKVKLPAILSDNMVLQADKTIKIWGTADSKEKITIIIENQKVSETADENGKWMVKLAPVKAGGPYQMNVEGEKDTITIKNILIGEVWLGSGQSNMSIAVGNVMNASEEISNANYPMIRLFGVKNNSSLKPLDNVEGSWVECSPQTVKWFSAVSYFFGRYLHTKLNTPVGLIASAWPGTPADPWTSNETFENNTDLKPIFDKLEQFIIQENNGENKKKIDEYERKLKEWEELSKIKEPENTGKIIPPKPVNPFRFPSAPTILYNAMISPITSFAIKGVIWYQGESNANRAYQYRKLFPAMIEGWRKAWDDDFPFLFVQLANFMPKKTEPAQSAWAELREAQLMTLSIPNTAMAVIIDIGDTTDIHPKNKQDVGMRLALPALAKVYGKKDIVYSGPIYKSMKIEENKIRLYFDHIGSGLGVQNSAELVGFAIAGEDKKFLWAKAVIDGNTIVVSNENVAKPVAVRYAWADNPDCNLYNKEKLPASPFRTDDWEGITYNNK
ncbi:MAG: sialate O-acetylesterase [Candidatus Firestonebacteria bacterium]